MSSDNKNSEGMKTTQRKLPFGTEKLQLICVYAEAQRIASDQLRSRYVRTLINLPLAQNPR